MNKSKLQSGGMDSNQEIPKIDFKKGFELFEKSNSLQTESKKTSVQHLPKKQSEPDSHPFKCLKPSSQTDGPETGVLGKRTRSNSKI